jgi:hypothetical protein
MTHHTAVRPVALTFASSLLATVMIGLSVSIARAEFRIESQTETGRFGLTIGGASSGGFSNIYQYPSSHPNGSHSNIYQPPSVYPQTRYDQHPGVIYQSPTVIYRRTEIISPDGNQRVILEDPEYVVPRRVIIRPDRAYHRRHNNAPYRSRRPNTRIYYSF